MLFLVSKNRPAHYSAEGVLNFSGLIAAGLAKCGHEQLEVHARGVGADKSKSRWAIDLTERGKLLVEAWKKGDQKALENALQQNAGLME